MFLGNVQCLYTVTLSESMGNLAFFFLEYYDVCIYVTTKVPKEPFYHTSILSCSHGKAESWRPL